MINNISLMTNEEKSKNYPVILNEYNYEWQKTFQEEKKHLLSIVGEMVENIFHFGSTAIPEMIAKPTVDILVIMKANVDVDLFLNLMIESQYLCTKYPDLSKKRNNCMNFVKPYKVNEIEQWKVYIHVREHDVPYPELLFCKYLCKHREIAMQYAELKRSLVIEYKYDRDGYLVAKNDFINKYTKIAIDYYKNTGITEVMF